MKKDLRAWSAVGMLAAGVALSTAGIDVFVEHKIDEHNRS
jgi:hypothetical protein